MLSAAKSEIDMGKVVTPRSIIVDCDAGIDDALALIILLAGHTDKSLNIKAITCVNGNTKVDNVVRNVFRTLHVCDCTDIPVYRGAYSPLLDTPNAKEAASENYHGTDGFGDAFADVPDTSKLQEEHAVCALHRITSEDPGNVSVVCLGPLTNIALAIKLYSEFADNVKELFVMGGNSTAQGNITPQAEFNFYADPESVHIMLNSIKRPLWLLPWESCLETRITHEWRRDVLGKIDKPCVHMMNAIEDSRRAQGKKFFPYYTMCDAFLAGIVLVPRMARNVVAWHADIELGGNRTRGQVVLDHLLSNKPNVHLIHSFDSEDFKRILLKAVNTIRSDNRRSCDRTKCSRE
ncbi:PREDICTED: inosine-uridine preferring nucleoside hydrolase-like [Wasmannia auropunctata]|uniref:inosine-uridine preferring nucleoside hydrolase-like n=1 Tax=Wasmannia auropunctata TaxID=64793 RepID=UPI0005F040AB|nr:PREDICTED: inosine-uridine preferring nucleoside hydrolase-like [Wasmannia auropunctata]